MKHNTPTLVCIVFVCIYSTACNKDSTFTMTYGTPFDETSCAVQVVNDGYIILSERTGGLSAKDLILTKVDKGGSVVWESTFAGSMDDNAYDLLVIDNNTYIITATQCSVGAYPSTLLLCYNSDGELIWQIEDDIEAEPVYATVTENEDIVLLKRSQYGSHSYPSHYLARIDLQGNLVWQYEVSLEHSVCALNEHNGTIYVVLNEFTNPIFYIYEYNADGSLLSSNRVNPFNSNDIVGMISTCYYADNQYIYIGGLILESAIPYVESPALIRLDILESSGVVVNLPIDGSVKSIEDLASDSETLFLCIDTHQSNEQAGRPTAGGKVEMLALHGDEILWHVLLPFVDYERPISVDASSSGNCVFLGTTNEYGLGRGDLILSIMDGKTGSVDESSLQQQSAAPENWAVKIPDPHTERPDVSNCDIVHTNRDVIVAIYSFNTWEQGVPRASIAVYSMYGDLLSLYQLPEEYYHYANIYKNIDSSLNGGIVFQCNTRAGDEIKNLFIEMSYDGSQISERVIDEGISSIDCANSDNGYYYIKAYNSFLELDRYMNIQASYDLDENYYWSSGYYDREYDNVYLVGRHRNAWDNRIKVVSLMLRNGLYERWEVVHRVPRQGRIDRVVVMGDGEDIGVIYSSVVDEYDMMHCKLGSFAISKLTGEIEGEFETADGLRFSDIRQYDIGGYLYYAGPSSEYVFDSVQQKWISPEESDSTMDIIYPKLTALRSNEYYYIADGYNMEDGESFFVLGRCDTSSVIPTDRL